MLFPTNVTAILLTAPEDWATLVLNHPTAIAFIGSKFENINCLASGAINPLAFLINWIANINKYKKKANFKKLFQLLSGIKFFLSWPLAILFFIYLLIENHIKIYLNFLVLLMSNITSRYQKNNGSPHPLGCGLLQALVFRMLKEHSIIKDGVRSSSLTFQI